MHLTIRLKLLLGSSLLFLAIFSGMIVYLVHLNTATLRTSLQSQAKAFATLATPPIADSYKLYADSGTDRISQAIDNYLALDKTITNVVIVDLQGNHLFAYNANGLPKITQDQASSFNPVYITDRGSVEYVVYPYFSTSGAHPFSIVYAVSNDQITREIHREVISLVSFGVLFLLVTSVLTYFLINRLIVGPVREVSRQANLISDGNLEQQIVIHGKDEIAALGSAVNDMAQSLKNSIAKLQEVDKVKSEFMAITSHNLRTPLTIINGYLESISKLTTVDQLKQAMERIASSVKRLGTFAEDVLTISSIELGEDSTQRSTVAIGDFMRQVATEARSSALMQDITFSDDIRSNAPIFISEPYLRSAVWNLIDNALKFTPKNGTITVVVTEQNKLVDIAMTDTGIGISPQEIPKLFTKFHRATSVMQYDYEGTGIGLYASKIIVEQEGGSISVNSKEGKGSTFTIHLPIATETKPRTS